ncbi:hypothetical protein CXF85_18415 [Colwellia sp. 75C3]|uniref:CopL family metal-binding regulatory protein n=1 Tax=Colwellia sp. 75C3 TaxID=888425 RepID=UPI000C33FD26|nr:CopL family metal-binding regulatory protein [Colwellia sp. 75C3]PKG81442.1 hypothetical protein CXF85_18415 [Colwellia sp. 75C3]
MFPSITKALMVLLLCLTFIGQVMASTLMPYQMMSMNAESMQEQPHDMAMMDHSAHQMASGGDNPIMDCCENDCACFIGGCSTLAVLSTISQTEPNLPSSLKIQSVTSLMLSQYLTSLYRPPIFS